MGDERVATEHDVVAAVLLLRQVGREPVLVGGCAVQQSLGPVGRAFLRPTRDVDLIVDVSDRPAFEDLQSSLRALGARDAMLEDAPINRLLIPARARGGEPVRLDLLPTEPTFLGFGSAHLEAAYASCRETIVGGARLQVAGFVELLALKSAAFFDRGVADPQISHDLEDAVALLDDPAGMTQGDIVSLVEQAAAPERDALLQLARWIVGHPEGPSLVLQSVAPLTGQQSARAGRVLAVLRDVLALL